MENNFHEVGVVYYLRMISTDTKGGRSYFSRGKTFAVLLCRATWVRTWLQTFPNSTLGPFFGGRSY
jgi:hypothetical protein